MKVKFMFTFLKARKVNSIFSHCKISSKFFFPPRVWKSCLPRLFTLFSNDSLFVSVLTQVNGRGIARNAPSDFLLLNPCSSNGVLRSAALASSENLTEMQKPRAPPQTYKLSVFRQDPQMTHMHIKIRIAHHFILLCKMKEKNKT